MRLQGRAVLGSLAERDGDLVERMDDPDCDIDTLYRTYANFRTVNGLLAGWRRTYLSHLRPEFTDSRHTLLDIGAGGGDVARALIRWARADGVELRITAIDPDPRAAGYVGTIPAVDGYEHRQCSSTELADDGARFDFVVSNHVLHHLTAAELGAVLADSTRLARIAVVHSDIRRSVAAYVLYGIFTSVAFRRSFIREDGLLSIRRSYRADELAAVVPSGWVVAVQFPHRVVLSRRQAARDSRG
ncbi:2-polyprenyl-3-methyl-5-hydroxy-6-metoxy-1,4-benzoquinol methylase [Mycetocola sp. CAN_C7]|uniref:methyltransferase domain-containing protein n=1 Tax=Mycetocola sp. CAN_C7 TaxID=2787724 RepID=UPI0018C91FF0